MFEDNQPTNCLYVTAWISSTPVYCTLVDIGAVVELVSPNLVNWLPGITIHKMTKEWYICLANNKTAVIKDYVWLPVNVVGVLAHIKAFIISTNKTFKLLLSKKWMY